MNYLAKLKAEFSGKALPHELIKPTKPPFVGSVSDPSRRISEIGETDATLSDAAMEARRQRVIAMLAERPGIKYAVAVDDPDADPVILALAVRSAMQDGSNVTCELRVRRAKYDPFLLLDLIERHGGIIH